MPLSINIMHVLVLWQCAIITHINCILGIFVDDETMSIVVLLVAFEKLPFNIVIISHISCTYYSLRLIVLGDYFNQISIEFTAFNYATIKDVSDSKSMPTTSKWITQCKDRVMSYINMTWNYPPLYDQSCLNGMQWSSGIRQQPCLP